MYLDHLHTYKRIELSIPVCRNLTVVHQVNSHTSLKAGRACPFLCEALLLYRKRERVNFDAVLPSGCNGKRPIQNQIQEVAGQRGGAVCEVCAQSYVSVRTRVRQE
jgi:hypothetical protein